MPRGQAHPFDSVAPLLGDASQCSQRELMRYVETTGTSISTLCESKLNNMEHRFYSDLISAMSLHTCVHVEIEVPVYSPRVIGLGVAPGPSPGRG